MCRHAQPNRPRSSPNPARRRRPPAAAIFTSVSSRSWSARSPSKQARVRTCPGQSAMSFQRRQQRRNHACRIVGRMLPIRRSMHLESMCRKCDAAAAGASMLICHAVRALGSHACGAIPWPYKARRESASSQSGRPLGSAPKPPIRPRLSRAC